MKELGYDDVLVSSWYAMIAPKGTPPEYVDKLFAALNQALAEPRGRGGARKDRHGGLGQ